MNNFWSEYKDKVNKTFTKHGDFTVPVLLFGLNSEVGELFDCTLKEITTKEDMSNNRISELGDVFWYIAAMELHFNVPNSLYTMWIDTPIDINPDHNLDLLEIHTDIVCYLGDLGESICMQDKDEIQFILNKVVCGVFDVCMYYGISPTHAIASSVAKMKKRHPEGFNPEAKKDYEAEFKETSKILKEIKSDQVVIDIKTDNRRNNPYKSILLNNLGKTSKFDSGDIVTDFFQASNYLYQQNNKKTKNYSINYSPNFRKYIDNSADHLYPGFIINGYCISLTKLMKNISTEGSIPEISNEYRPILMYDGLVTMEQLLDHIVDAKSLREDKEILPK